MQIDTMYIGCSPAAEDCVQLGSDNYVKRARPECERFIRAIRNYLGEPPEGADLIISSNPHDFGTYLSVDAIFEIGNEKATKYAYDCEGTLPDTWKEMEAVTREILEKRIKDCCCRCGGIGEDGHVAPQPCESCDETRAALKLMKEVETEDPSYDIEEAE